jgi:2-amino-4-hydroxy-6-hydroxymethyldihydropteridine diphosphokinase
MNVFIGVGSNIEPEENIYKAFFVLSHYVRVLDVSTHYLTKAEGRKEDPDYINGVWKIETDLKPMELKYNVLRKIEDELGRIRADDKYTPREIDLDILLYDNHIVDSKELKIPDKSIYTRSFVCIPLSELEPDFILPDTNRRISDITVDFDKAELMPLYDFTEKLRLQIKN